MVVVVRVGIRPDDLPRHVDPAGLGPVGHGIVDGHEETAAVDKAVVPRVPIEIVPDDLARIVDARCEGSPQAQGIGEYGVRAVAVQEAMDAVGVIILIRRSGPMR